MSDCIETLVDLEADLDEASSLAMRLVDELISRRVIRPTPQRHVSLGQGPRYATGRNAQSVAAINNGFPSGMDVIIGRHVYDAGGYGLDTIACPECGRPYDLADEAWADALGEWASAAGPGKVRCEPCDASIPIVNWRFEPTWGFGELAFRFHGWKLSEPFVKEVSRLLDHRVAWVRTRV